MSNDKHSVGEVYSTYFRPFIEKEREHIIGLYEGNLNIPALDHQGVLVFSFVSMLIQKSKEQEHRIAELENALNNFKGIKPIVWTPKRRRVVDIIEAKGEAGRKELLAGSNLSQGTLTHVLQFLTQHKVLAKTTNNTWVLKVKKPY